MTKPKLHRRAAGCYQYGRWQITDTREAGAENDPCYRWLGETTDEGTPELSGRTLRDVVAAIDAEEATRG